MAIDKTTLALAKKYTDNALAGAGAIKGAPCQIQSITEITGGHRVTYLWEDNDGEEHTDTMDVMNGEKGDDGSTLQIDDVTPANDKVYSSNKVENALSEKLDARFAEVTGGGTNLFSMADSHEKYKPSSTKGADYTDGEVSNSYFTTNLMAGRVGDKFKFKCNGYPFSYMRVFYYNSEQKNIGADNPIALDSDGYPYFTISSHQSSCEYFCLIFGYSGSASLYQTLEVYQYDSFGSEKITFDELNFNANNIAMAKEKLGLIDDILTGKKWAVAGDSFTAGDGITDIIQSGPYAGQKVSYPWLIANRMNMTVQNLFLGGRTLALPANPVGGSFDNSFTNYYQSVAADADYLTIYLGINDSHHREAGSDNEIPLGTATDNTTATFYGAWNVILPWLIENRPNLKIGIIVSNGCETDEYRQATIAMATKYGIPYIDLNGDSRTPCMLRSTNSAIDSTIRAQRTLNWRISAENQHPNAPAYAYEATFIEEFLRTL